MPTALENARTRFEAILTELAAITASKAGGLPTASGEGTNPDHVGYKDGLYRELKQLIEMFPVLRSEIGPEQAPFEVLHRVDAI